MLHQNPQTKTQSLKLPLHKVVRKTAILWVEGVDLGSYLLEVINDRS